METSTVRRPRPDLGSSATGKQKKKSNNGAHLEKLIVVPLAKKIPRTLCNLQVTIIRHWTPL